MDERVPFNSDKGPQAKARGQFWRTALTASAIPQRSGGISFSTFRSVVAAIVRRSARYYSGHRSRAKRGAEHDVCTALWNRFAALFVTHRSRSSTALRSFMACVGLALVSSPFPSFLELRDVGTAGRRYCWGVLPHFLPTTGVPACLPSCFADSEDIERKSDAGYHPFCRESGHSGLSCSVMRMGEQDSRQKRIIISLLGTGEETRF
jgi:hypothetical protein